MNELSRLERQKGFHRGFFARSHLIGNVVVVIVLFAAISSLSAQVKRLTLNNISDFLKNGVSSNRIVYLVEQHGLTFELDGLSLQRLRQEGASEAVLAAVKRKAAEYADERQLAKQQEEAGKRLRDEEKIRTDQEKRRKEQQEAEQRVREAKQRQEEVARAEEERKRVEEEQRKKDEAEKARTEKERQEKEEARLANEKRRIEEEAMAKAKAKAEEIAAIDKKNRQEENPRTESQARLLEMVKNGRAAEPSYSDGESWYFNVVEKFVTSQSRALSGVYELRYSSKRFSVFNGNERITSANAQIGVLLVMFGQGDYMGGRYLNFPLSVGQKWTHQFVSGVGSSLRNHMPMSWNSETEVKGIEKVPVSSGIFAALKIVREAWGARANKATFTYYYSPETKSVIKMLSELPNGSRSVELIKLGAHE